MKNVIHFYNINSANKESSVKEMSFFQFFKNIKK